MGTGTINYISMSHLMIEVGQAAGRKWCARWWNMRCSASQCNVPLKCREESWEKVSLKAFVHALTCIWIQAIGDGWFDCCHRKLFAFWGRQKALLQSWTGELLIRLCFTARISIGHYFRNRQLKILKLFSICLPSFAISRHQRGRMASNFLCKRKIRGKRNLEVPVLPNKL